VENAGSVVRQTAGVAQWRTWLRVLLVAGLCGVATTPVLAQRRPTPTPGANPNQPAVSPQEFDQLFNSFVAMQAQQELQLSDDQYGQFVVRLRALQDARRRAQNQRNRVFGELRRLVQAGARGGGAPADESLIKDQLKSLEDVDTRSAAEIKQAQANLDQLLDVRQQARFRLLEERVERQKVDLLTRVRQGAGRQGAARGQGGAASQDRF
jgi:hypothetical protein